MEMPARVVSGPTASAKAFYVAGAAQALPHGVVLYVVPSDADLEQSVADVSFFISALEGLSQSAADRQVLPFPAHQVDSYRGLAPHVGVTSARARALHGLATGTARILVASAAALTPRVTTPEHLLAASIDLRPGQDIAPTDLTKLLVDAGFSREDPADEHAEFAVRGGIVDVFPAGETRPVRLEFAGDTIESVRTYDPETQRSISALDQLTIMPLRDVLQNNRGATVFDYLARTRDARIMLSEPDEVAIHVIKLGEQLQHSYEEALNRREEPLQPSALVVDWTAIEARLSHATNLTELALDVDAREVRCQPTVELHGRVADWVAEIRPAARGWADNAVRRGDTGPS